MHSDLCTSSVFCCLLFKSQKSKVTVLLQLLLPVGLGLAPLWGPPWTLCSLANGLL